MKRAAPTRSTSASATSPTTSTFRARARAPPLPVRPPSRIAAPRFVFETCHAGARPNSTLESAATATV